MLSPMKIYTVYIKPGTVQPYEKPVFVREGFNLMAFLFTFFWALYYRLWKAAAIIFAANLAIMLATKLHMLSMDGAGVMQLALAVLVGFHANDWLRARLAKRGYIMADIAAADSLLRAEQRYFERYLSAVAQ